MNAAHLHVALNHFPVFGTMIATGILFFSWGRNSIEIQRTGLLLFVVAALVSIPVFLTGEGAEDIVEKLPGVQDTAIEAHEEMAKITFWLILSAGALSLIELIRNNGKNTLQKKVLILTLVIGLAISGLAGYTAWLGGKIRHSEFGNTMNTDVNTNGSGSSLLDDD